LCYRSDDRPTLATIAYLAVGGPAIRQLVRGEQGSRIYEMGRGLQIRLEARYRRRRDGDAEGIEKRGTESGEIKREEGMECLLLVD